MSQISNHHPELLDTDPTDFAFDPFAGPECSEAFYADDDGFEAQWNYEQQVRDEQARERMQAERLKDLIQAAVMVLNFDEHILRNANPECRRLREILASFQPKTAPSIMVNGEPAPF